MKDVVIGGNIWVLEDSIDEFSCENELTVMERRDASETLPQLFAVSAEFWIGSRRFN